MNNAILEIEGLTKHFGKITAVDNFSLKVEKGNIFGILGPNGSGKTTTLGIIVDIIKPSSGNFSWFGKKPTKNERKKVGAIVETPVFYPYLTALQNLQIICDIKKIKYNDIERVIDIVDLKDRIHSKYRTYSLGMKQRLAIAAALIGKPEVLILDEPTNGLDPQGIAEIRQLIKEIATRGITIILASHLLDEVQKICTHVVILSKGKKLQSGIVEEVLNEALMVEVSSGNLNQLKTTVQKFDKTDSTYQENNKIVVKLKEGAQSSDLNKYLFDQGIIVDHLAVRKKSLEKYFLEVLKDSK